MGCFSLCLSVYIVFFFIDEADENIEKAELLQQSPEQLQEAINSLLKRYKEKTVGLNSRTAVRFYTNPVSQ